MLRFTLIFILTSFIFGCQNAPRDEIQFLKSQDITQGKGLENDYLLIEADSNKVIMDSITSIINFQFKPETKTNDLHISLKSGFHTFTYNLRKNGQLSTGHIDPGQYLIEIKNNKNVVLLNARIALGSGHIRKIAVKIK